MSTDFSSPMGIQGFGFVEFASSQPDNLRNLFRNIGFRPVGKHPTKDITIFRQGDINFLVNAEENGHAARFAETHGPCASSMALRFSDPHAAFRLAVERGAKPLSSNGAALDHDYPAVQGIGGAALYFVNDPGPDSPGFDSAFEVNDEAATHSYGFGFHTLDHLTHNVFRGRLGHWAEFYERIFDFYEIRYFDIKGKKTGLHSKAMSSRDGSVRIPLNEESELGGGQIDEYLQQYNGEGIQHIALACDDLYACCEQLKLCGTNFMPPPPQTYYEMLDERLPGHGEPVDKLQSSGILVDGSTDRGPKLLLQIFSENSIGPIFFEFIQRKQDEGFGEGNFTALFESIERDQMNRGVI